MSKFSAFSIAKFRVSSQKKQCPIKRVDCVVSFRSFIELKTISFEIKKQTIDSQKCPRVEAWSIICLKKRKKRRFFIGLLEKVSNFSSIYGLGNILTKIPLTFSKIYARNRESVPVKKGTIICGPPGNFYFKKSKNLPVSFLSVENVKISQIYVTKRLPVEKSRIPPKLFRKTTQNRPKTTRFTILTPPSAQSWHQLSFHRSAPQFPSTSNRSPRSHTLHWMLYADDRTFRDLPHHDSPQTNKKKHLL